MHFEHPCLTSETLLPADLSSPSHWACLNAHVLLNGVKKLVLDFFFLHIIEDILGSKYFISTTNIVAFSLISFRF